MNGLRAVSKLSILCLYTLAVVGSTYSREHFIHLLDLPGAVSKNAFIG